MGLTVVVTRNAPDRLRGFLRSTMVEVSSHTFLSVFLTKRAREAIWAEVAPFGSDNVSVLMVYEDSTLATRCVVRISGEPQRDFLVLDGLLLSGKMK
jgi:CRISPR-associated protein Cas2